MQILLFSVHNMQGAHIECHKLAEMRQLLVKMKSIVLIQTERSYLQRLPLEWKRGSLEIFGPLVNGYSSSRQATLDLPCVK